jgi:hypothetical protein
MAVGARMEFSDHFVERLHVEPNDPDQRLATLDSQLR